MVRVWYMDNEQSDPRLDHKKLPCASVTMEDLYKKTGVEYFHIDADNYENDPLLKEIRQVRNYTYEDEVTISKDTLLDFEAKLKTFYSEHLHTDEEIRLVLDGSGYFDVRDEADKWVRIEVEKNDLIIIPAGIYHRFTLDMKNYIKAKRYFVGEPIWQPYNRPADDMECRKKYLLDQSRWISKCTQ